jgi:hypothetical protein
MKSSSTYISIISGIYNYKSFMTHNNSSWSLYKNKIFKKYTIDSEIIKGSSV